MKITTNSSTPPERKIAAVLGVCGVGIFFPGNPHGSVYINKHGRAQSYRNSIREQAKIEGRTPVYEGDSITITF